jgi:hypothetical protein
MQSLRQVFELVPKLWAVRVLVRPGSELAGKMDGFDMELHLFALATELWRPGYRGLRYFGLGDKVFKLGRVVFPPKGQPSVPDGQEESMNAKRLGPARKLEQIDRASVKWIEIWGMDSTEFEVAF